MRPVRHPTPCFAPAVRSTPVRLASLAAALTLALAAGGAWAGESSRTARGETVSPPRTSATPQRPMRDAEPAQTLWRRMQVWIALGKSDEGGEPDPTPTPGK